MWGGGERSKKGCQKRRVKTPLYTSLYRGFGFVTFKTPECVDKVLEVHNDEAIYIDDKAVRPSELNTHTHTLPLCSLAVALHALALEVRLLKEVKAWENILCLLSC